MDLSDYLENALLDHITGNATFTTPTNLYVALFSDATNDAGGGTELTGGTAPGYAREIATFAAASGGVAASDADVVFTASGGNWPTVTNAAIYDALTAGNSLWHGALSQSEQINDGGTITFSTGNLTMALD